MRSLKLAGQRFGRLVCTRMAKASEIPALKSQLEYPQRWWIMKCDCGSKTAMRAACVQRGNQTCGNKCPLRRRWSKPTGEAAKWAFFVTHKKQSDLRGIAWALTLEQFLAITGAPCHYCGVLFSKNFPNRADKGKTNGNYRCNGIDRLNCKVGYISTNCVPCCKFCNVAKAEMTVEEFKSWIVRVYAHCKLAAVA